MDKFEDIFETSGTSQTEQETVEEATADEVDADAEQAEETADAAEQDDNSEATETEQPAKAQDDDRSNWIPQALADERAKRQQYERELADARAQLEAAQKVPKTTPNIPDPIDDLEGFRAALIAEVQAQADAKAAEKYQNYRIQDSWVRATEKHGEEAVEAAKTWAQAHNAANPQFAAEFYNQRDPINWLVQQHNRHAMLSEWEKDPDAWALERVQERGLLQAQTTQVVEAQKQEASKRPRSLAEVPSASRRAPAKSDGFDDIFA